MAGNILRLRTKHVIDIYDYYMQGDKEAYKRSWEPDRRRYGDAFIDGLVDFMEKFWNGYYTQLEVVTAADDLCRLCGLADTICKVRDTPDEWDKEGFFRNMGLGPGTYDAEEVRKLVREEGQKFRRRDLPPL